MRFSNGREELSKTGILTLRTITGTTFILATFIDVKVTNTKASFLASEIADI